MRRRFENEIRDMTFEGHIYTQWDHRGSLGVTPTNCVVWPLDPDLLPISGSDDVTCFSLVFLYKGGFIVRSR